MEVKLEQIKTQPETITASSTPQAKEMMTVPEISPKEKKKIPRPSASKKYPGQIMVGVAKLGLNLLQYSNDQIDKLIIEIICKDFLGKSKEDYKINNVEKIRSYFITNEADNLLTRAIKTKFLALVITFFKDEHYRNWLNKDFKGAQENKTWYIINKVALMDRILYNKKTHFALDMDSNPYLAGNLTVDDSMFGELKKKIKTEDSNN